MLISLQTEILVAQSVIYFVAAAVPIYLALIAKRRIMTGDNQFLKLIIALATFVVMQGIYHLVSLLGYRLLAKGILEPLSFGILILFGIFYITSKLGQKQSKLGYSEMR
jgi:ABC-type nickel/cobalt efflux system permease component RcnA